MNDPAMGRLLTPLLAGGADCSSRSSPEGQIAHAAPRRRGRLLTPLLAGGADRSRRAGFLFGAFHAEVLGLASETSVRPKLPPHVVGSALDRDFFYGPGHFFQPGGIFFFENFFRHFFLVAVLIR